jgi:hypothetical protein
MKRIPTLLLCSLLVSYFAYRSVGAQTSQGLTVHAQGRVAADLGTESLDSNAPDQGLAGEKFPSIAVKPNDGNVIVAAMLETIDGPCLTVRSEDGEQTWADPVPLQTFRFGCDAPVVRWAPDGSRVYAAYIDGALALVGAFGEQRKTILVSSSADNGKTWSGPLAAIVGWNVFSPWLDVHTFPSSGTANSRLYVTAQIVDDFNSSSIVFARSFDHGASFRPQRLLAQQGTLPRVIGGKDQDVLACWQTSDATDSFDIRCRASSNFGLTFGNDFTAVNNKSFPLPGFLGPNGLYHRWADGMAPSLMITNNGVAHIAFAADPVKGSSTAEDGDIFYVRSRRPYSSTSWTAPRRLNDGTDHRAQGHPTIVAKLDRNSPTGHVLAVCWEDHRNSIVDNELFDIYCDRTLPGWGPDIRISDSSSHTELLQDYFDQDRSLFIGHVDSSASRELNDRSIHVIWPGVSTERTLLP